MPETLIHAERELWGNAIAIHMAERDHDRFSVAEPVVFVDQPEGRASYTPLVRLNLQAAQKLMDELWNCGLRPSEGTGSAGSLAATEKHLKDMQVIAKGLLRRDGVEV